MNRIFIPFFFIILLLQLINNLKFKGHKVYIFSNIGSITYQKLSQSQSYQSFFNCFDGIHHVEAENNWLAKPNQEAYLLFLRKFNIDPTRMVFVDDKPKNVIAAQLLGITAIQYRSSKQLLTQLFKMSIIH